MASSTPTIPEPDNTPPDTHTSPPRWRLGTAAANLTGPTLSHKKSLDNITNTTNKTDTTDSTYTTYSTDPPVTDVPANGNNMISLAIGGEAFCIKLSTLRAKSSFFEQQFQSPISAIPGDGEEGNPVSWSWRGDGAIFKFIADYMAEGRLPVFYDIESGEFDEEKYGRLRDGCKKWAITGCLDDWIRKKEYLECVEVEQTYGFVPTSGGIERVVVSRRTTVAERFV